MQTFRFSGPDPVDLPGLALVGVTPGTCVEVDTDTDDGKQMAESMRDSPIWEHVPDPERSKAAKKAAASRAADGKES